MVYETFLKTIQSMVQTRLNKKANVSLRRVLKNNGLMLDGLSFTKPGSRLSTPTIMKRRKGCRSPLLLIRS